MSSRPTYQEFERKIQELKDQVVDLEHKKDSLDELKGFKKLLFELSAKFVHLPSYEIDNEIEKELKIIGEFLGIDRITLAELTKDRKEIEITHIYTSPGVTLPPINVIDESIPWFMERIRRGKTVALAHLPDDLPEEAEVDRQYCLREGVKSGLAIPFKVGQSILGGFLFASLNKQRTWPEELVNDLQHLGEILANALARKKAEEELRKYELIVSNCKNPMGILDRNYTYLVVNDVYAAHMNKKSEDLVGRTVPEMVEPQFFYETMKPVYDRCLSGEDVHMRLWYGFSDTAKRYLDLRYSPYMDASGNIGGLVASAVDITEMKRAEEALKKAYDEIEQLNDRLESENIYLRDEIEVKCKHEEIIGQSDAIKVVLSQVEHVAATDSTVLIMGETGTGKELLARAIHNLSSHQARPMVTVNCAVLPPTLVENELFGREKGAYTGALSKQAGRFEVANRSTIFLDEISELSLELQAKLLRVIQEGRIERLGSSKSIEVDVRVIAATNQDIAKAVQEGRFRKDLYYRLNVFPITVPLLRERREDIPLLAWAFVKEFSQTMGKRIDTIPRKSMEAMQRYPWPGNIRELRNVIERAMIVSKGTTLNVQLPGILVLETLEGLRLEDIERKHILKVLENARWRIKGKNGAAQLLGLKPTTLHSRMKKLGIKRPA